VPTFQALILRTKTALSSLFGITGSRAWWPWIREASTGGWQRNEDIQVQTVLSNPTLNACITLIAGDIAKLRPMLVEQDEDRIWQEVESSAFSPVLDTPNGYQNRVNFFEWWMVSKLCHGNTYVLKARDGRGVVQALYILDPFRVMPLKSPDGSIFYRLETDVLAGLTEGVVVPAREIIHDVMCPLFHPLCGVSPIYAAGFPALQGLNIRAASDKFFSNGSKPGGVLTAPGQIAQATADRLKAYWDTNFSGDNTGKIAVLGDGLKYEPMAMTADQSKLVEQLGMTGRDIAAAYHMPLYKVNLVEPTYNNASVLNQQYWTDCLQKHIVTLQILLTKGLGLNNVPNRMLAVEFDIDDLQLMDPASRIEAGIKAITGGMSPNEVRFRFFDLGPVKGGDEPFLQRQNWPLNLLGTDQPTPNPPPTVTPPSADMTPAAAQVQDTQKEAREMLTKALAA
jgi:HK97 family phage portal protein